MWLEGRGARRVASDLINAIFASASPERTVRRALPRPQGEARERARGHIVCTCEHRSRLSSVYYIRSV